MNSASSPSPGRQRTSLPPPVPEALVASAQLQALIAAEIAKENGWLSFARFMELALYAPGLGYYSGGATKLGKEGDFTTAPEISPLFARTLAHFIAPLLAQSRPQVMEFGAGSGQLAHDMLQAFASAGIALEKYYIVELSGQLRARQQQKLAAFPQVEWLSSLPASFSGVIVGNEVLDAMPVQLVQKDDAGQGWQEVGVAYEADGAAESGAFRWQKRAADSALLAQIAAQMPQPDNLPPGYLTELHGHACAFMASVARMQAGGRGAAIWLDYGFAAHGYYLDQRRNGTLMCHYRHHAHGEPFYLPGLQDITAHVDFTAMARIALENGLDILSYSHQAGFLLDAGITLLLQEIDAADAASYLPATNAVGKLLAPHEMGELFKVLVLGKEVQLAAEWGRFARQAPL